MSLCILKKKALFKRKGKKSTIHFFKKGERRGMQHRIAKHDTRFNKT